MLLKILNKSPYWSYFFLSLLCFCPYLGASHLFDWDEINFAESAREMILTGDYWTVQINFKPFWEKPPLFIWLQALSMQVFQVWTDAPLVSMEFAARFPNALVGMATVLVLYRIGVKEHGTAFGHRWAFAYLAAFTPHLYASSGIIDPLFNLGIFLGLYFFYCFNRQAQAWKWVAYAGLSIGLAMLTKGPVALLLWGLSLVLIGIFTRSSIPNWRPRFWGMVLAGILAFLIFASWYGMMAYQHGFQLIRDFFAYQLRLLTTEDAGHGQPFYYHTLVLLLGCFPISIWAFHGLFRWPKTWEGLGKWQGILFWVVLILFSLVKTKIVHYSSMCWIPMGYFAAQVCLDWEQGRLDWKPWWTRSLLALGSIWGLLWMALPWMGANTALWQAFVKDAFAQGNLQAPVYWSGWEKGIGLFFLLSTWFWVPRFSKQGMPAIRAYFISGILSLSLFVAWVVPKIEGYTQGTVIDFYQAKRGQKLYIEPLGFKSYAHLLYFEKPGPGPMPRQLLLQDNIDRPVYFIMKSTVEDSLKYHPKLERIKEENGFLFYRKKKSASMAAFSSESEP